ncbi:class I SAM-dependent RNA methyltransferase [Gilvimarinus sp. F26214L]|uniref:class I SAM-dependent RNA methyltransferase n=1 Tax=Gilvimarinus sp. DZF01 TaxID=3461371 RepID=UPI0040454A43
MARSPFHKFKPPVRAARPAPPEPRTGEVFSATVRDQASDGRGIVSHPSGLVVFVPGVWTGERGTFRFVGMQNRVGLAQLLELEAPSPSRNQPLCPHHGFAPGDCGGCPWQFVDYPTQLAAKQRRVEATATQLGAVVEPIWSSPSAHGYRNRAQLKTDGEQLGYVSAGSHTLAPISDCPVLTEPNRKTLRALAARLPEPAWRPARKGQWTTLNIDESIESADQVVVNSRLPFRQSNDAQNERMRHWLAERCAELDRDTAILELFCGAGNFTEVLAAAGFRRIVAVDGSGPATESLSAENLPGVTVMTRDLFKADSFPSLFRVEKHYEALVLDPPRDGFKLMGDLLRGRPNPEHIFYISCNPATLFRDLETLQAFSYRVTEIQPVDQAPHTPHVEVLVQLALT